MYEIRKQKPREPVRSVKKTLISAMQFTADNSYSIFATRTSE